MPGIAGGGGPESGVLTAALVGDNGKRILYVSVWDIADGFELQALCDQCREAAPTGMTVSLADLPLTRAGRWRHDCGGSARLPDDYVLTDRKSGDQFDLYAAPRLNIAVSAVTRAQLLHLSQAARAVQRGEAGAAERLDRVLAEAPEPIRRLRDRLPMASWTREQRLMLAGLIVALVTALMPLVKADGAVTDEQLVKLIEQLVDQQSDAPGQQGQPEERRTGGAGGARPEEHGTTADPLEGSGSGSPPEVQRDQGVDHPDQ